MFPFDDWLPAQRCGIAAYPTRVRLLLRNAAGLPPAGLKPWVDCSNLLSGYSITVFRPRTITNQVKKRVINHDSTKCCQNG